MLTPLLSFSNLRVISFRLFELFGEGRESRKY
jgi:hypothetical protein